MNLRYLAANGTNSIAISTNGDIYGWGSKKFGLIPDDKNDIQFDYQSTPQQIFLNFQDLKDQIQNKFDPEDAVADIDIEHYVATSISMGAYHAVAILNDKDTLKDLKPTESQFIFITFVTK